MVIESRTDHGGGLQKREGGGERQGGDESSCWRSGRCLRSGLERGQAEREQYRALIAHKYRPACSHSPPVTGQQEEKPPQGPSVDRIVLGLSSYFRHHDGCAV